MKQRLEPVFTDDKFYVAMLFDLINQSAAIAKPSITAAKKAELTIIYDASNTKIESYRRGKLVERFPDMRRLFTEQGLPFDEPISAIIEAEVINVTEWTEADGEVITVDNDPFLETEQDDFLDL